jgi:hypothetical protein
MFEKDSAPYIYIVAWGCAFAIYAYIILEIGGGF